MNSGQVKGFSWQHLLILMGILTPLISSADESADLAKQLANPIASLISVPIEVDFDSKLGPGRDGERTLLVFKPVLPFSLNDDWNLVTRTIVPFIDLDDIAPGVDDESGLGDVQASLFFSPKAPTAGGWIWGVGPIALLPTASDDSLGSEKWGLGADCRGVAPTGALDLRRARQPCLVVRR